MKGFNKLALAAAVVALPLSGVAMQPLQDEEMSTVVGQDGISIEIDIDVEATLALEDTDGLGNYDAGAPGTNTGENAGMIYIPGMDMQGMITIDIDAGANGTAVGGGVLQVEVGIPDMTISNFALYVRGSGLGNEDSAGYAAAQRDGSAIEARFAAVEGNPGDAVLELGTIELSAVNLSIQLGQDAEQLVRIDSATPIEIDIAEVVVVDQSGTGSLVIEQMLITGVDVDGTTIGVDDDGLKISVPNIDSTVVLAGVGISDQVDPINNVSSTLGNVIMRTSSAGGATAIRVNGK